jgi:hypothetical protein
MSPVTTDEDQSPPPEFTLWGEEPRGNGLSVVMDRCVAWNVIEGTWCVTTANGEVAMLPFRNWLRLLMVPADGESPL